MSILNKCVEYLNEKGIPHTLNGCTLSVHGKEFIINETSEGISINGVEYNTGNETLTTYMLQNYLELNYDRLVELSKLSKYKPSFIEGNRVKVNNNNTSITLFDNGYGKLEFIDYIYNMTSKYPEWEFDFIIDEDEFVFQYGYYKTFVPITEMGSGKLNYENLDGVIELVEKQLENE